MCLKNTVLVQLVTSATGNQQVNSNDLNSLIQGVRLTQVYILPAPWPSCMVIMVLYDVSWLAMPTGDPASG